MAKKALSKATLHKEVAQLKRYRHYLPSLDLKRQQLIAERLKVTQQLEFIETQISQIHRLIEQQLPMLSNTEIDLTNLVTVKLCLIAKENIVGINLPVLQTLELACQPYSLMIKPHWVDLFVVQFKRMLKLKVQLKIARQRQAILQQAVNKITQRVNLFDKVLIPRTERHIAKIRIFLADAERVAVVRAKITKQKRLKQEGN